jgi:multidrug efflux pump subunit AcrA (membrane-fusion protein)
VALTPGRLVEAGAVLVALDVSEEQAELAELEAEAKLARTTLERLESLRRYQATSQEEVDQARAQLDMAQARMARVRAVIAKKTIRAPFRARVGIADEVPLVGAVGRIDTWKGLGVLLDAARMAGFAAVMVSAATALRNLVLR